MSSLGLATEKDPRRRRVLDDACCCLLEAAAIALFCIALARLERRKGAAAASQPISARARVARQGSRRDDKTVPEAASCWRLDFLGLCFDSCWQESNGRRQGRYQSAGQKRCIAMFDIFREMYGWRLGETHRAGGL